MAIVHVGLVLFCQIFLYLQAPAHALFECTYEDVYTRVEFTRSCVYGCCETDCCTESEGDDGSNVGAVIAGVAVGIAFTIFLIIWVTCRLVPSCPLAKWRRSVILRRTIVVSGQLPRSAVVNANGPQPSFPNPLAVQTPPGYTPSNPPPSYDQVVQPTFEPLPAMAPGNQEPPQNKV